MCRKKYNKANGKERINHNKRKIYTWFVPLVCVHHRKKYPLVFTYNPGTVDQNRHA